MKGESYAGASWRERSKLSLLISTGRPAAGHVPAHSLSQTSLSFPHSSLPLMSSLELPTLGSLDPPLMLRLVPYALTHSQDCVSVCLSRIQCPASVFLVCTDIVHGSRHAMHLGKVKISKITGRIK